MLERELSKWAFLRIVECPVCGTLRTSSDDGEATTCLRCRRGEREAARRQRVAAVATLAVALAGGGLIG